MKENKNGKKPIIVNKKTDIKINDNQSKKPIIVKKKSIKRKIERKTIIIGIVSICVICLLYILSKPSIENIKDSVVMIETYDEKNNLIGTGSGFCAYKSNYIITNYHVIEGGHHFKVKTSKNQKYEVDDIVIFNNQNDIAILDVDANLKPLALGSIKTIKTGQKVTTIGSPLGEFNTVSTGIISNADNSKGIQITAPISPGSSGGVLLNRNNKVIGITYATLKNGNNLNYAISIDYLKKLYNDYKDEFYFEMNNSIYGGNLDSCFSGEVGVALLNEISFDTCGSDITGNFVPNSIYNFYEVTNLRFRLEHIIDDTDWDSVYYSLSDNSKNNAVEIIKNITNTEYCSLNKCNIENIKNWTVIEFFMNLKILDNYELAIIMADLENYYDSNAKFNEVNSYPLPAAQKTLVLYLIGNRNWNNINSNNKRDVFDLIDSLSLSIEERGTILSFLGYRVVYDNDSFTAYW